MNAKQKAKIAKVQNEIEHVKKTVKDMQTQARTVDAYTVNLLNHLRDLDKELEASKNV